MKPLESALLVGGFSFGEGPRWHDGRLWFADVVGGAVMATDVDGVLEVVAETTRPSGLGWLPDGTLAISPLYDARIKHVGSSGVGVAHDLAHLGYSLNDMVVGVDGRIYVDVYREPKSTAPIGDIALVTPDGDVSVVATDLATPNGLGLTADGSTLIVSETNAARLLAFEIEPDGKLGDRRVFAELGEGRQPDGLCLDADGAVWVGCYSTSEFLRVLDGGEVTHRIEVDNAWAVAPALGGEDRRTLFLVVNETSDTGVLRGESSGRIEYTRVDVAGAGRP